MRASIGPAFAAAAVLAAAVGIAGEQLPAEPLPAGAVTDPLVCPGYAKQSYALYLPSAYTPDRRWPILYAFDAGERGRMVVELFRDAAERLGYIIASSNSYRSEDTGDTQYEAIRAIWEDTHTRLAIDPRRVYATGFSGGARGACALAIARAGEVAGVIGVGGGFPGFAAPSKDVRFAYYGIAGLRDFNYVEMVTLDHTLGSLGIPHAFDTFDGEHEWAPAETCARALAWMELRSMKAGTIPARADFVDAGYDGAVRRASSLETSGDPVAALRALGGILADYDGLRDTGAAKREADRIRQSGAYEKARAEQEKVEKEGAEFVANAQRELPAILSAEPGSLMMAQALARLKIPDWSKKAAKKPATYASYSAARSLESLYVQAVFYIPRWLIEQKQYGQALQCLKVAAAIKSTDASLWFRMARVQCLAGDEKGAISSLKESVKHGLDNPAYITDDPAFEKLRAREDYAALIAMIREQAALSAR